MARLLFIDDKTTAMGESFSRAHLVDNSWTIDCRHWYTFDLHDLERSAAELVVVAAVPAEPRLFHLFDWLRSRSQGTVTIVALPLDADPAFVQRCVSAADDFVLPPISPTELRHRIARLLLRDGEAAASARTRLNSEHGLAHLVGNDPAFVREVARIPRAARTNCEVLVTGETGTGKELCARAIHHLSPRSNLPFVCADCAALPDQLFENEMFGHERGAFTDAHRSQKGLVAVAEDGTLFLDEIDALSLAAQAKLLRLIQDHTYRPLGAERHCHANVRVVAATNKDLPALVQAGTFRRDLFFRINVLQIHMIALRERRGDIAILAAHFLEVCCVEMGCGRKRLAASSLQLLASLEWPGNVRELLNLIRRAVVFCDRAEVLPVHLLGDRDVAAAEPDSSDFRTARARAVNAFERHYVADMLRRHHGNVTQAAKEAGKDRRVFGRMMKRLQIDRDGGSLSAQSPALGRVGPTCSR